MADKKGNIFKRFGKKISDIIAELKRVTWPTGEKLAKTSAVVLLVIVFFAVYLTLISDGGRWILDKIGFYDIYELVNRAVEEVPHVMEPTLEDILEADGLARQSVRKNYEIIERG